ncbi:MAG: hypothetical protein ACHQE5_08940 [Actinomycetes bacterium]
MSHVTEMATTGVVAVVRPEHSRNEAAFLRPTHTQTPVLAALNEGSGLSFDAQAANSPFGASFEATFDRKPTFDSERTFDLDAVITQDPYQPVSGKQLWSHPPV